MTLYRKTWRHEVLIEAESKEQAEKIFESIDLGRLNSEVADGEILSHSYIGDAPIDDIDNEGEEEVC